MPPSTIAGGDQPRRTPIPSMPPSTFAGGNQPHRTPPLKAAADARQRRPTPPDPTPSKPPSTLAGGDQPHRTPPPQSRRRRSPAENAYSNRISDSFAQRASGSASC